MYNVMELNSVLPVLDSLPSSCHAAECSVTGFIIYLLLASSLPQLLCTALHPLLPLLAPCYPHALLALLLAGSYQASLSLGGWRTTSTGGPGGRLTSNSLQCQQGGAGDLYWIPWHICCEHCDWEMASEAKVGAHVFAVLDSDDFFSSCHALPLPTVDSPSQLSNRRSLTAFLPTFLQLVLLDAALWILTSYSGQISRRFVNLPYILWIVRYTEYIASLQIPHVVVL